MRRPLPRLVMLLVCSLLAPPLGASAVGLAQETSNEQPPRAGVQANTIPLQRGLAYLARESAAWVQQNHCYSCHNNSDAVVALVEARQAGWPIADSALLDTTNWLAKVESWDDNGGDSEFADRKLAVLQFAYALSALKPAKLLDQELWETAMAKAAARVVEQQRPDGSWTTEATNPLGSPAAVGLVWGTVRMRAFLGKLPAAIGAQPDVRRALQAADAWLQQAPMRNLVEAAAWLWHASQRQPASSERRRQALQMIADGQHRDGGWGPYATAASQVYDTALVMLALAEDLDRRPRAPEEASGDRRMMLRRGAEFLRQQQLAAGGWPGSTRPPGADSYAQHISTTAAAVMALLRVR